MALKRKADWVGKFEELSSFFPHLDTSVLIPKPTADYYYRAVAFLHEALTVPRNVCVSSIKEIQMNPASAFRLQYITPCLASSVEDLKQDKRDELFNSDKWVFTHKRNGVRAWVVCMGGFTSVYSRNYSSEDGRLLNYAEHLAPLIKGVSSFGQDLALDVEVEMASDIDIDVTVIEELGLPTSPLEFIVALLGTLPHSAVSLLNSYYERTGCPMVHFNLISTLFWNKVNYINRRLGDSYSIKSSVISEMQPFLPILFDIDSEGGTEEEKVCFLERLLSTGAEGVVAHNMEGYYFTGVNRKKDVFVKLKRSVSATNLRGSSIDAWISGYELGTKGTKNENRITTLILSVTLNDSVNGTQTEHNLARVSGLSDSIVKQISDHTSPVPILKQEILDRVVEVDGQGISHVNWRLTHPRFIRFRDDKSKEDCVLTTEFIESCIDRPAHHTRL